MALMVVVSSVFHGWSCCFFGELLASIPYVMNDARLIASSFFREIASFLRFTYEEKFRRTIKFHATPRPIRARFRHQMPYPVPRHAPARNAAGTARMP
jgi:hypothetical protein